MKERIQMFDILEIGLVNIERIILIFLNVKFISFLVIYACLGLYRTSLETQRCQGYLKFLPPLIPALERFYRETKFSLLK